MNTIQQFGNFEINYGTGREYWSPEFSAIVGLPADHVRDYQSLLRCVHPEDRRAMAGVRERAFRNEPFEEESVELRVCAGDGQARTVELMARSFGHSVVGGTSECILGFVADVTDRMRVPCFNSPSRAEWSHPVKLSRFGSFDINFQTGVECWTPGMAAIFGLREAVEVGFDVVFKHVHPEDRSAVVSILLTVMRPESPRVSLKHRIIREDGVERCVQMAGCTLFDTEAPQRPVCFVGIIADITEDDEESDKAIHHG